MSMQPSPVQPLTISELESAAATPRSTIYFYVREGLLPPGQRSGAGRAIYSDAHVELLAEIRRLKGEGVALAHIKRRMQPLIERHQERQPDLVAQRNTQVREAILRAAALRFARNGYERTRIRDVIRDAGTTPPVFYTHFASKRQLFIESFGVFVRWSARAVEPRLADEPDPIARLVRRMRAHFGLRAVSPVLVGLARSEGLRDGGESRAAVIEAYRSITAGTAKDFAAMRKRPGYPPLSDELMAHGVVAAFEESVSRTEWDDAYTLRDVMVAHLFLHLALHAAYSGEIDLSGRLAAYLPLVDEALATAVEIPHEGQGEDEFDARLTAERQSTLDQREKEPDEPDRD
jgi:AcrR family transcriptional regulator